MAFCINCGQQLPEGAKFCAGCGKAISDNNSTTQRKTVYDGEIYKCPNCGDILDAYESVCETCGYERRGAKATGSVRELQLKLEELYAKKPPRKSHTIFTQALSGGQISNADEEIVGLIKNFSIPNNKEDIMEFIILASSNIDMKVYGVNSQQYQTLNPAQREISDAWLAKYEQAYQKAQLVLGGTQDFLNIQSIYDQKMREIQKRKRQLPLLVIGCVGGSLLIVVLIWLLVFLTGSI